LQISFFIQSKGLKSTAIKFANAVYDFIESRDFQFVEYPICKDPQRADLDMKCIIYKRKFTIVFYQFKDEVIVLQFIPSKMIVF
jgi:hypothetical protein